MKFHCMGTIIISAGRFLDLLQCVTHVANEHGMGTSVVQLNVLAQSQALQMVATSGMVLSIAQRPLGFGTWKQADLLDSTQSTIEDDVSWLLQKLDCELLILALKKVGIKRGKDNEEALFYIQIAELRNDQGQSSLRISVLGDCSCVILEPRIIDGVKFPDWKAVLNPAIETTNYLALDMRVVLAINACWGNEKIYITFSGQRSPCKITRLEPSEEQNSDLIVLMPMILDDKNDKLSHQLSIAEEHKKQKPQEENVDRGLFPEQPTMATAV